MKSLRINSTLQNRENTEVALLLLLVVLTVLVSFASGGRFISRYNLFSMAYQLPEFGLLSLAMAVVIWSGGINLSIVHTATLSSIVGAIVMLSLVPILGEFFAVLIGATTIVGVALGAGFINGLLIGVIGVGPVVVTLGTMILFEGISLRITRGGAISGFPVLFDWFGNGAILGVPVPMVVFVLVIVLTLFLFNWTTFGRAVTFVGSNPKVARFSGVRVRRTLLAVYVYSAFLCGLSGLLMASRYNSAKESYGSSYLLQAVAVVVLGGTDFSGGVSKIAGTIIAVGVFQVISNGLTILGTSRHVTTIVSGMILIVVLWFNHSKKRENVRS